MTVINNIPEMPHESITNMEMEQEFHKRQPVGVCSAFTQRNDGEAKLRQAICVKPELDRIWHHLPSK